MMLGLCSDSPIVSERFIYREECREMKVMVMRQDSDIEQIVLAKRTSRIDGEFCYQMSLSQYFLRNAVSGSKPLMRQ